MAINFRSTLISMAFLPMIVVASSVKSADFPQARNNNTAFGVPGAVVNWGGVYAGLNAGYGWGRANSASISGFGIGGHLGANVQQGAGVFGGEIDLGYTGIDYRGFSDTFQQKWLASARLRAGYAFDRFLPYVTGGLAYTTGTLKNASGKADQSHFGYVIGIGAEAMLTDRVSARVEVLHYGFARERYALPVGSRNTSINTNLLRFGLSYRF
ncbi:MAG: outer membrane protein [Rhabdaerophilum sp.]